MWPDDSGAAQHSDSRWPSHSWFRCSLLHHKSVKPGAWRCRHRNKKLPNNQFWDVSRIAPGESFFSERLTRRSNHGNKADAD